MILRFRCGNNHLRIKASNVSLVYCSSCGLLRLFDQARSTFTGKASVHWVVFTDFERQKSSYLTKMDENDRIIPAGKSIFSAY